MPATQLDELYMKRAVKLATQGAGWTAPNPMVGCVIVKDGRIIGEGCHERFGEAHAEVNAVAACSESPRGATAYVTLEPCAHHGKTPPCADMLADQGIARVVIGSRDPNPVATGGAAVLRSHGVQVDVDVLADECAGINPAFYKRIATGMPFVTAKWAMTIDGKIATKTGDSKWVSSPESRKIVHILRGTHRALLIGSGTLHTDDPQMNCRISKLRQPLRVFADSKLSFPSDARALSTDPAGKIIVACLKPYADADKINALTAKGVDILVDDTPGADHVNLVWLLKTLASEYGVDSVMSEAGGVLNGALFDANLVDRVDIFISPRICGGDGHNPVGGMGMDKMASARRLKKLKIRQTGGDLHVSAQVGNWDWLKPAFFDENISSE